jgi:hypothetical protein
VLIKTDESKTTIPAGTSTMSGATHPSALSASFCIIDEQQREQQQQRIRHRQWCRRWMKHTSQHYREIPHTQASSYPNHLNDDHTLTNNIIFYTILKDFAMHNH